MHHTGKWNPNLEFTSFADLKSSAEKRLRLAGDNRLKSFGRGRGTPNTPKLQSSTKAGKDDRGQSKSIKFCTWMEQAIFCTAFSSLIFAPTPSHVQ